MRPLQQKAVKLLEEGRRSVFLPYGAGKTWIGLYFAEKKYPWRTVIFCKTRNIITWIREIEKRSSTDFNYVFPMVGNPRNRERLRLTLRGTHTIHPWLCLIPYSVARIDEDALLIWLNAVQPTSMIADQSEVIKNPRAQITRTLLRIAKKFPSIPRIALSGNPIPEDPTEIWTQFAWCYWKDSPFPDTYYKFLQKWFIKGDYSFILRYELTDKFFSTISAFAIQVTEEEEVQMRLDAEYPTPWYVIEHYPLALAQREALTLLFENWALDLEGRTIEYRFIITLLVKAQQICSGFVYDDNKKAVFLMPEKDIPKLKLLVEVVNELMQEKPDRKIVVWRKFRAEEDLIYDSDLRFHGVVIGPDETALLRFMDDKDTHIIIMPVDCSQGFNELVVADVGIFFSNSFSIQTRTEAEARIERPGQKASHVIHLDLVAPGSRDAEVIAALQAKDLSTARLKTIIDQECKLFKLHGSKLWQQ